MRSIRFRSTVRIPKTGKIIDLAKLREQLVKRIDWLNLSKEGQRKLLQRQLDEFQKLETAISVYARTGSFKDAGKAVGVHSTTAMAWIKGERLPQNASFRREQFFLESTKPLKIRRGREPDFAYVLGAMLGNAYKSRRSRDHKEAVVRLVVSDRKFAGVFKQKLESATGLKVSPVKKRSNGFTVDCASINLIKMFNELTNYGADVPQKFLDTKHARAQFVQAVFDSRGTSLKRGPKKSIVLTARISNSKVKKFVLFVLIENGLHPRVWTKDTIVISPAEIPIYLEKIGLNKKMALPFL